jgi:hypothetical protein
LPQISNFLLDKLIFCCRNYLREETNCENTISEKFSGPAKVYNFMNCKLSSQNKKVKISYLLHKKEPNAELYCKDFALERRKIEGSIPEKKVLIKSRFTVLAISFTKTPYSYF